MSGLPAFGWSSGTQLAPRLGRVRGSGGGALRSSRPDSPHRARAPAGALRGVHLSDRHTPPDPTEATGDLAQNIILLGRLAGGAVRRAVEPERLRQLSESSSASSASVAVES